MARPLSHDDYGRLSDNEKCLLVGRLLDARWRKTARPEQLPFSRNERAKVSLFCAGRGTGKSRSATEWMLNGALTTPGMMLGILGPTYQASVGVGIHSSESGMLSLLPDPSLATWNDLKKTLTFTNGSQVRCFSAEHRKDLRGPEFHRFWVDEMADLSYGMDCWKMLFPSVRLKGLLPAQIYATGTPRPTELMLHLMDNHEKSPETYELNNGATKDNVANLDESTVNELYSQWEGTRYYLQEIEGILLREAENAMWTQETISLSRCVYKKLDFEKIAIGVDPAVSSDKKADETGIIVAGLLDAKAYVLADYSIRASPLEWSRLLVRIAEQYDATSIVYEKNLAGPLLHDVMRRTLDELGAAIRLIPVQAHGQKQVRAEPVAALYEAGRVKHMPNPDDPKHGLQRLESQMTTWEPQDTKSPDRIDALVHVVKHLLMGSSKANILRAGSMPWGRK